MKDYLIERLAERSTWLAFTALATASGVNIAPELSSAIMNAGIGIASIVGIFSEDK